MLCFYNCLIIFFFLEGGLFVLFCFLLVFCFLGRYARAKEGPAPMLVHCLHNAEVRGALALVLTVLTCSDYQGSAPALRGGPRTLAAGAQGGSRLVLVISLATWQRENDL